MLQPENVLPLLLRIDQLVLNPQLAAGNHSEKIQGTQK